MRLITLILIGLLITGCSSFYNTAHLRKEPNHLINNKNIANLKHKKHRYKKHYKTHLQVNNNDIPIVNLGN